MFIYTVTDDEVGGRSSSSSGSDGCWDLLATFGYLDGHSCWDHAWRCRESFFGGLWLA